MNQELDRPNTEDISKTLRASEISYRRLFEAAQDGILILDSATGRVTDVNPFLVKLLGFSHDDMVGKTVGDLSPFKDLVSNQKMLEKLQQVGYVRYENLPLETWDGRKIAVEFVSNVYQAGDDQVIQCNIRDITARKRMEEEGIKLQAQLIQSQKMASLGTLAGGVAHDINNVLGAILGVASAHIEAQPQGSPLRKALGIICKAAERGGKLVKSLLRLARQSPIEVREQDVNAILREGVSLLEYTTLAKVRLLLDLAPDLRPIRGDSSALSHAFMNLCVNAVDAMPEGGTLTLQTRNLDNDWIEVVVEDNGIGMAREVLEKAMDPFYTTKEVGKGTGLGLSMAHSTVTAHHGQIEIQSEPNHGTCVRMRFPAPISALQAPEPVTEPKVEKPLGAMNVLLVDDDELIQSSNRMMLETFGHTVTIASNGEEALTILEGGFQPDVVILDMNMPGMGGSGTLPRLRTLNPTVPVLLATGQVDQAVTDLVAAHPPTSLLPKPYSIGELKQHLEEALKLG
jgi:PAS domain S-box-containing protein